jgi:hypothetical protein
MKRFGLAITLSCLISAPVLAGEVPSVGPVPTPGGSSHATSTAPGDIPSLGAPGEIPMVTSDAAFSALLTVLGIFAV